jgi:hypothetical protein
VNVPNKGDREKKMRSECTDTDAHDFEAATLLRSRIHAQETEIGIEDLSLVEKYVICAASELDQLRGQIRTSDLEAHDLLKPVSRPTFYRALTRVIQSGWLTPYPTHLRGRYKFNLAHKSRRRKTS